MTNVATRIYVWTPKGMRVATVEKPPDGYIPVKTVEQMLQQAHLRGRAEGIRITERRFKEQTGVVPRGSASGS